MYPGTAPGSDLDGAIGAEPSGISKLCLSCHDGTVAIDAYGGSAGTESMGTFNPAALLGTDLSDDHPISITYTTATALADGELNDPASYILGGDFIVNSLDNNEVQCSTCHDVHNGGAAELVDYKLLKEPADGSAICLACHAK
jgi:predicted CXXCH cytochrome family protein